MKLNLYPLQNAVASLNEAWTEFQKDTQNKFVRDAVIQRFEYTYELSHKMLKRYLELSEPNAALIDEMSFPTMVRTASERGLLLNDWSKWSKYREARNLTIHPYDENKAIEVCAIIAEFIAEVNFLKAKLEAGIATL